MDRLMLNRIPIAPRGIAILAVVGPSLVWRAEYIGSGEVILDGILLTPIQAAAILVAFLFILPKMVSRAIARLPRPNPVLLVVLGIAAILFGVLCVLVPPGSLLPSKPPRRSQSVAVPFIWE